jgi:hypothetical protein
MKFTSSAAAVAHFLQAFSDSVFGCGVSYDIFEGVKSKSDLDMRSAKSDKISVWLSVADSAM